MNRTTLPRIAGIAAGAAAATALATVATHSTRAGTVTVLDLATGAGVVAAVGSAGWYGVRAGIDRHEATVRSRQHRRTTPGAGGLPRRPDAVPGMRALRSLGIEPDPMPAPAPEVVDEPAAAEPLGLPEMPPEVAERLMADWEQWKEVGALTATSFLPSSAPAGPPPATLARPEGDPYLALVPDAGQAWPAVPTVADDDTRNLYRTWMPATS